MVKPPPMITQEWLKERKACKESVRIFAELFPDGGELTLENALRCTKRGLNLNWLARTLGYGSWTYQAYDNKAAHKLIECFQGRENLTP